MGRYFVTGATGFLGGELTKQLISRGHRVVALIRDPARAGILRTLGVELHQGDVTDRDSLVEPMRGVDGMFHCAAWYKVGVPSGEAERINVGISPLTGEELQKLVADVSNLSPALLDKVRAAYSAGKTN